MKRRVPALAFALASLGALAFGGTAAAIPDPSVDQSQVDASWANLSVHYPPYLLAQTFTAGRSGQLTDVDLHTWQNIYVVEDVRPAAAGPVTVSILATNGSGLPTGSALATVVATPSVDGWNNFAFASSIPVVSGTMYAIVVESGASDSIQLDGTCTDRYAGGQALAYDVSVWLTIPTFSDSVESDIATMCALDFAFRTYVTADAAPASGDPAPTSGTPPPTATASARGDGGDSSMPLILAGLIACLAALSIRRLAIVRR